MITGPIIIFLAIRGIRRSEGKPKASYSAEEVEQAKFELEKMYIVEYGKPPVPGGDETIDAFALKDPLKLEERYEKASERMQKSIEQIK